MSHTLGKREREFRDQGQTPCLAMEGRNGETCDILGISDISHMLQSRLDFALDSEVGAGADPGFSQRRNNDTNSWIILRYRLVSSLWKLHWMLYLCAAEFPPS